MTESVAEPVSAPEVAVKDVAPAVADVRPAAPRRSLLPAYLGLLLVAGGAGAGGWYLYQQQLVQRGEAHQAVVNLQQQLDHEKTRTEALKMALAEERGSRQQSMSQFDAALGHQAQAVAELRQPQQMRWQLSEVAYLARLASRRLWYEQDVGSAIALLEDADHLLLNVEGAQALDARAALATDLATLRAVPAVDLDGYRLTLASVLAQAADLPLPHADVAAAEDGDTATEDSWRANLSHSWHQILSQFFVVRHDDAALPLVMPDQVFWLRQNLRLTLQRADLALKLRDEEAFQAAIQEASTWVNHYFDTRDSHVLAVSSALDTLAGVQLKVTLPKQLAIEKVVAGVVTTPQPVAVETVPEVQP